VVWAGVDELSGLDAVLLERIPELEPGFPERIETVHDPLLE
jgi:hypothetical protein